VKAGDAIDVWIVDHALGQGGMGSVYRCHNRNAPRILAAVKVLDPTLRRQEAAKLRFVREAEILFALDHPNIVKVRNVRMDVSTPYLEMEFVDGVDLEHRLQTGPYSLSGGVAIIRQLLSALSHIHSKGVQHRDIKPSNAIVQADGRIKLVDFGIATEADAARLTTGTQAFGSVCYAPPEWGDVGIDPVLWDVYAAGLVFSEILTGRPVFELEGTASFQQEVVRIMREKHNTPAVELPARFPDTLVELVREMTRCDPARRLRDLTIAQRLLGDPPLSVPPAERSAPPPPRRSSATIPDADPGQVLLINGRPWNRSQAPGPKRGETRPTEHPAPRLPDALQGRTVVPSNPPLDVFTDEPTIPSASTRPSFGGVSSSATESRPRFSENARGPVTDPPGRPPPPTRPWRPSLPGSSAPTLGDPSYATAVSKNTVWIELRWSSSERFRHWCATQLVNYVLVLPEAGTPLPKQGTIRVLLSHDTLHIDCAADHQASSRSGVCYRLGLDALQVEALHRWLAGHPEATIGAT
jgi:serine/threonine protein kinase